MIISAGIWPLGISVKKHADKQKLGYNALNITVEWEHMLVKQQPGFKKSSNET